MKLLLCFLCLGIAGCGQNTYRITDNGQTTDVQAIGYKIVPVVSSQRFGQYPAGWFSTYYVVVFDCSEWDDENVYYGLHGSWKIQQIEDSL